jgi:acetyltransferase-like isoleucine patch superfamily enzyme
MNRLVSTLCNRLALVCPGGFSVRPRLHRWRGVRIGKNVWFGLFVYIDELHPSALSIGDNCTIGIRTSILTHFYWGPRRMQSNGKVTIENNVFIGPHCVILPNVTIGAGSVIQAGTIVSRSVPPGTFWGSPPAGALAHVTVPLTSEHGYLEFLRGIKAPGQIAGVAARAK